MYSVCFFRLDILITLSFALTDQDIPVFIMPRIILHNHNMVMQYNMQNESTRSQCVYRKQWPDRSKGLTASTILLCLQLTLYSYQVIVFGRHTANRDDSFCWPGGTVRVRNPASITSNKTIILTNRTTCHVRGISTISCGSRKTFPIHVNMLPSRKVPFHDNSRKHFTRHMSCFSHSVECRFWPSTFKN